MDILSPELVWIAGRCYRVNEEYSNEAVGADVQEENDLYETGCDEIDNESDREYEIEQTQNGGFRTSFHIPQFYYAQIIGSKGAIRKRIELETKTKIYIPRQGQQGLVVVAGSSEKNVIRARRRIDLIVVASRNKQPFTHFLSIPINALDIKENFEEFKMKIIESFGNAINPRLFQIPEKLHLTIGTMCLMDNEDRILAAELLNDCKKNIIDPIIEENGLFKLQMSGLEIMNDDPSAVDVLYGCIQEESQWANDGVFQNMINRIVELFSKKGLMQKQYDNVKLHVTLMNSLFCQDSDENPRKSFDASSILKSFQSYNFGLQVVQEIHLSQRYSTACDGYYQSSMIITC